MEEKEWNSVTETETTDIDVLIDQWQQEEPATAEATVPEAAEEAAVQEKKTKKKEKVGWKKTVLMYLHDLVYLLAGLILVFLLLFRVVVVSGTSMNSTLLDGDYLLLLSNTFYTDPQYGDIIVASKESFNSGAPIVKRVIATEGQTVKIKDGIVYVNDVPLEEDYILESMSGALEFGPQTVPEGCLFVMGDNRNNSKDSRDPAIGFVDKREVLGKVFFLFVPGTNYGKEEQDFSRIGVIG